MYDNLLNSKESDVMHDNKHTKKQHLGLLATNLVEVVEAIRGRSKKPPPDSCSPRRNQLRLDRLESTTLTVMPSGTFPVGTTVYENINNHNSSRDLTIRKSRYRNSHHLSASWLLPGSFKSENSQVEIPKELISLFKLIKCLI